MRPTKERIEEIRRWFLQVTDTDHSELTSKYFSELFTEIGALRSELLAEIDELKVETKKSTYLEADNIRLRADNIRLREVLDAMEADFASLFKAQANAFEKEIEKINAKMDQ